MLYYSNVYAEHNLSSILNKLDRKLYGLANLKSSFVKFTDI